jgi:hypothetical protein
MRLGFAQDIVMIMKNNAHDIVSALEIIQCNKKDRLG